ncbi:hypothetical protein [Salimicrobium halophilum]|uniref:Uncharacterized protein n=1 Tax=Salimicrobium halophilum TaxID=86666 RepID=A0A1G8PMP1_9BACI|nr:hypothetical protein [Salimicrobium halophilum]SDI93578.1 hypothetical protein SAMN04490247_0079 [Salimicrobium halophilum]
MSCPNCMSREIGRIGVNRFYCWNCCIEIFQAGGRWNVAEIDWDGSLCSLNDLFDPLPVLRNR